MAPGFARATLPLLLLLRCSLSQELSAWSLAAPPLAHDSIEACAVAHNGSALLVSYAHSDGAGGSIVRFLALGVDGSWLPVATHTPQFSQPYDNFVFRAPANGPLYLGLRIVESFNLSSVLRSTGAGAGEDGFEGCYAFSGEVWDFALTREGDLRCLVSPDNSTLQLQTFNHSGYNSYPSADAWGPPLAVPMPPSARVLNDITLVPAGSDVLWAALSAAPSDVDSTQVAATTLSNSSTWLPLGAPLSGSAPALVVGEWGAGSGGLGGVVCVARTDTMAHVGAIAAVACAATNGTGAVVGIGKDDMAAAADPWVQLPPALTSISEALPTAAALLRTPSGGLLLLVLALDVNNASLLRAASCVLAPSPLGCVGPWRQTALPGATQPVTQFAAVAAAGADGAGDAIYVVMSEGTGQRIAGDALTLVTASAQ